MACSAIVILVVTGCGATSTKTVTIAPAQKASPPPSFTQLLATDKTGVIRIEGTSCSGGDIGTGFLISPRLVATVDHVTDEATKIVLKQDGVPVATGTVIGDDRERDVALIEASKSLTGHIFKLATRSPELGENVAAIGFPLGLPLTVTKGSVSGLDRTIPIDGITRTRLVQTDAAVNPGNSGGPLISQETGEVIGLVDLGTTQANGLAFAVSADVAAPLLAAWRAAPQAAPRPACSPPPEEPKATTPEASPHRAAEEVVNTLNRHFEEIEEGDYAAAWQDFTPAEAQRLEGEQTWVEGQKAVAPQHFVLNVQPEVTSQGSVRASIVEFKTESSNGCQEWSGSWSMAHEGQAWKIAFATLSPTGCS